MLDPPEPLDRSDEATAAALRAALRWIQTLVRHRPDRAGPEGPAGVPAATTCRSCVNEFAEPYQVVGASYGWSALDAVYGLATFAIEPGQAIVVTHRPPACRFWNLVVWNAFMATESLLDARTSINIGAAVPERRRHRHDRDQPRPAGAPERHLHRGPRRRRARVPLVPRRLGAGRPTVEVVDVADAPTVPSCTGHRSTTGEAPAGRGRVGGRGDGGPRPAVLSEEAADDDGAWTRTGCGSSIRSTGPASSPSRPAPTGRCTSPWWSTACSRRAPWRCPAAASLSTRAPRRRPGRATMARPGWSSAAPGRPSTPSAWPDARRRAGPDGIRRRQGHGRGARRRRRLRPLRRPVRVGLGRAGRRRAAAGLHVSRLDGSPLRYNQPDPWLPDLLICRPELADAVIRTCREVDS